MKILIISNKLPYPPNDGSAIATLNLAVGLTNNNFKLDILAITTPKHNFDINKIPQNLTKKINFYSQFINTNIKILHLLKNLFFSKIPYNAERFINQKFSDKIKLLIQKNNYDIVQFEGLYVLPYINIVKKNSNAIISFRAHNIEHEIWSRTLKNTKNILKKIYLKNLVKRLKNFELSFINKYDIIIPITQRDENFFSKLGNTKASITIPTGISISEYKAYQNNSTSNDLCFIGSLDWLPNQEGLLWFINYVLPIITQKIPGTKLFIAGRNAPKWLIKKFQIKNIIYKGQVENSKKFISQHKIVIVPILSGSGMRIKIIEAMALSKTVITTSIGAEGLNTTNNINIIIANNPQTFAKKTIELLKNKKKADYIAKNAAIFISKNFDNFAIAKHLSNFYLNFINHKK
jgi:glycosyltransferase involved in cell wall biosynthesis